MVKEVQMSIGDKISDLPGVKRQCSVCGSDCGKD